MRQPVRIKTTFLLLGVHLKRVGDIYSLRLQIRVRWYAFCVHVAKIYSRYYTSGVFKGKFDGYKDPPPSEANDFCNTAKT